MKRMFLIAVLVFSTASFAAGSTKWSDIEISSKVTLIEPLEVTAKGDKKFIFDKKLVGYIEDISHLSYINVELYKVRFKKCSSAKYVSELFLKEIPQSTKDPVVVGIEMKKGCLFEIYVEFKDLSSKSLFSQK